MAPSIININHKKYAVGLFWQPTDGTTDARNFARTLARGIDSRLNLFITYRNMVGLGATRYGHRSGMPSAASDIMGTFSEYSSFLAAFAVDGAYLLVAVRNGVILADKIFTKEDEAREEYFKLAEIPDWAAFIAPGEWGAPRAIDRKLRDVLTGNHRGTLKYISRIGTILLSLLIVVLFILAVFKLYHEPILRVLSPQPQIAKINPELAAEYHRQIEEKNKELDAEYEIVKPEPEPMVMPFDNLPDVYSRADVCYRAIGFLMQPIAGWIQTSVKCEEDFVVAEFSREYGTLGDFYNIASELMPGVIVQEHSDSILTVRAPLPGVAIISSQDERDADTIVRAVATRFQELNTTPKIGIITDTIKNDTEIINLDVVEIGVSSKLTPTHFMEIFNDFGGVYMTRCEWTAANRTWNYEVIIYAK